MTIDGLSQTTGAERLIDVEPAEGGVRLTIRERDAELVAAVFPTERLMAVITDQPEGLQAVVGTDRQVLAIELRRNEVLLAVGAADAAVGLDDLTDALAGALPS